MERITHAIDGPKTREVWAIDDHHVKTHTVVQEAAEDSLELLISGSLCGADGKALMCPDGLPWINPAPMTHIIMTKAPMSPEAIEAHVTSTRAAVVDRVVATALSGENVNAPIDPVAPPMPPSSIPEADLLANPRGVVSVDPVAEKAKLDELRWAEEYYDGLVKHKDKLMRDQHETDLEISFAESKMFYLADKVVSNDPVAERVKADAVTAVNRKYEKQFDELRAMSDKQWQRINDLHEAEIAALESTDTPPQEPQP